MKSAPSPSAINKSRMGWFLTKTAELVVSVEQGNSRKEVMRKVFRMIDDIRSELADKYGSFLPNNHEHIINKATDRVFSRFAELGICTWEEASRYSEQELLKPGHFGPKSLEYVREKLSEIGLELKSNP